jgi:hypothetical protein
MSPITSNSRCVDRTCLCVDQTDKLVPSLQAIVAYYVYGLVDQS